MFQAQLWYPRIAEKIILSSLSGKMVNFSLLLLASFHSSCAKMVYQSRNACDRVLWEGSDVVSVIHWSWTLGLDRVVGPSGGHENIIVAVSELCSSPPTMVFLIKDSHRCIMTFMPVPVWCCSNCTNHTVYDPFRGSSSAVELYVEWIVCYQIRIGPKWFKGSINQGQ